MKFEIVYLNLPEGVRGCVTDNLKNGYFSVVVDEKLTDAEQIEVIEHELSHIKSGDLSKQGQRVGKIERESH